MPFVQYVACLALVAGIQRVFSNRLGTTANPTTFPVRIKWPNDIYALPPSPLAPASNSGAAAGAAAGGGALKIGGILCQSTSLRNTFSVVVGVGLNVSNSEPTTCVNELLSARAAALGLSVAPVAREEVLASFAADFEDLMQILETSGFSALEGTYKRYWMHTGQRLRIQDPENPSRMVPVTVMGLTAAGFLRARDEAGRECELHPDGNSLDMMQGLIKRKTL